MPLKTVGTIPIPGAAGSDFDHAAFDAKSRRVFIAHTARDCIEVIDHDAGRHLATLPGFPGVAGAVADDGQVLVTNRGSASVALLDATTLETHGTFKTGAAEWRCDHRPIEPLESQPASESTEKRRRCSFTA